MTTNQITMIGPNSLPMLPVPCLWIMNNPTSTVIVAGRMKFSNRDEFQSLHGREDRDRRRDDTVAVQQGSADHPKQNQNGQPCPLGNLICRNEREQCQDAAFAVIVGAQDEDHVFQRYHRHERPKNERDDAENVGGDGRRMADAGQRDLQCVKRAGTDIAEYDAKRGKRQNPGAS